MLPAPPAVFLKFDLALDELFILPAPIVYPFAFLAGQLDELILGHMYGLHNMRQKKKNQENQNNTQGGQSGNGLGLKYLYTWRHLTLLRAVVPQSGKAWRDSSSSRARDISYLLRNQFFCLFKF